MTLLKLDHVGITVSDMERSGEFYSFLLGSEPLFKMEWNDVDYVSNNVGYPHSIIEGAFWKLPGGGMLELLKYHKPTPGTVDMATYNTGNTHLCLATDDIFAEVERLRDWTRPTGEIVSVTGGPYEGGYLCYVKDPDGISIELMQPPPTGHQPGHEIGDAYATKVGG